MTHSKWNNNRNYILLVYIYIYKQPFQKQKQLLNGVEKKKDVFHYSQDSFTYNESFSLRMVEQTRVARKDL